MKRSFKKWGRMQKKKEGWGKKKRKMGCMRIKKQNKKEKMQKRARKESINDTRRKGKNIFSLNGKRGVKIVVGTD